ncbi:energy transducer TonB [Candidatus Poribacteria bacterium]|nr:energy transducer TonB [Candidatus Poribacteria bacterium]MYH84141.1 energy transducer TonB [Candidatus Poribacteria bacterium]MYK93512.1 energy transducer TonB [Candidatus Poribacteria bacterium]
MIFRDIGNLKITPTFVTLFLLLSVVTIIGCIGSLQTTTTQPETDEATSAAETETPTALAELQLSTPKTNYATKEAIPLELNIQNGKFDLLVPSFSVATKGAFTQITVNDANGQIVNPKHPITQENPQKYVQSDGKTVRCIHGFELKASETQELKLKDIQRYYLLQPGTYTVTLSIELEVYTESITEEHPEIRELKQDMARIQNDPNLQGAAKQDALSYYQEQIKFIQERHKDAVKDIYLPVKSLRGKASLVSNSITVTVEPETEPPVGLKQIRPFRKANRHVEPETEPPAGQTQSETPSGFEDFASVVHPKFKNKVKPEYPKSLNETKKGGEVLLQFTIDENGSPKDIVALTNLGFGLEAAAIEALKKCTFDPATKDGKPISMQVQTSYNFTLPENVDSL